MPKMPSLLRSTSRVEREMGGNELLSRLTDCHVHPTDSAHFRDEFEATAKHVSCHAICCMSSNLINQDWTTELAEAFPGLVLPAYGLHPWFCHAVSLAKTLPSREEHYKSLFPSDQLTDGLLERLPKPVTLEEILEGLKRRLQARDDAFVGEIGLDKSFLIPDSGGYIAPHSMKPEDRDKVTFTKLKTPIGHQVAICEAQIDLAIQLGRAVSLHCVTAFGPLVDMLARLRNKHKDAFLRSNIDMHSWGGSVEIIQQLQKTYPNIYFSFSTAINSRSPRLKQNIQAVDDDRLLVESDMGSSIGSSERLWDIAVICAEAKDWDLERTVATLERNWTKYAMHLPT